MPGADRPIENPGMATLDDGRLVPSDSPLWRECCARRYQHVLRLRQLDLAGRRLYLAEVERKEGELAVERLRLAYIADFESRKLRADAGIQEQP